MTLYEPRNPEAMPPYPEAGEHPPIRVGPGAVMVATRCPDAGDVTLEIWAGDPGLHPPWESVFDDELQTDSNGFNVGDVGDVYKIDAPPGRYRVRAHTRRDQRSEVEAVRFVLPENPELSGRVMES
jgi:hypothetical protein